MGRSSAEQAAQNREKILAAAAALFRARGVDDVSVAEVMSSAGMTVGGFYKHFASKEALVQEACALAFRQALSNWGAAADQDSENRIGEIIRHYFKERPPEQTCPLLAFGPASSGEDIHSPIREAYEDGASALFDAFSRRPPRQDRDVPDGDAAVLFAAMVGAKLLARATNGSDWSKAVMKAVTEASLKERRR